MKGLWGELQGGGFWLHCHGEDGLRRRRKGWGKEKSVIKSNMQTMWRNTFTLFDSDMIRAKRKLKRQKQNIIAMTKFLNVFPYLQKIPLNVKGMVVWGTRMGKLYVSEILGGGSFKLTTLFAKFYITPNNCNRWHYLRRIMRQLWLNSNWITTVFK